jgi:hypothetical protein
MTDLDDPQAVAAELRRRGLPVHRADDLMRTDTQLHAVYRWARLSGWTATTGRAPRPRHINRGHLIELIESERP